jgi:peptide/nickel transport system substrate-binding protein
LRFGDTRRGAAGGTALAQPMHGISMYGEPALPPDFAHLPYANPDAPTGGRIVTGEVGSFDSLNPHIRQGSVPWQLRFLAYESLMGRSWDEPFALYGLLAESVEVDPNHMWVEFTLRPEARFSDGSPVTVEDVIWSYETLGTEGHPRYLNAWTRVASIEATGERSVRITFTEADRELALIMGLRPILKAAQWEGVDFTESGLDRIPIATAPYVIDDFEAGRFVSLRRNPDYWGADLPFRRGTNVIDEIRMEFFADGTAMFEAFTSGILTTMRETNAADWAENYDFPRVQSGEVVLSEIPHRRPSGITGLVMNTRHDQFADWRVREAMIQAFNFEFINQTLNGGTSRGSPPTSPTRRSACCPDRRRAGWPSSSNPSPTICYPARWRATNCPSPTARNATARASPRRCDCSRRRGTPSRTG